MAVTNAITDLIKSIGELLSSVFGAAYAIVHSFISGALSLFAGFFAFVSDLAKGVVDLTGGVGKFVAGKFLVSCQPGSALTDQATPSSSPSSPPRATPTCASSGRSRRASRP
jgi:hypothetical protein